MDGKTGLNWRDFSWVRPQTAFLDSRLPARAEPGRELKAGHFDLKVTSTPPPFNPKAGAAQARVGFVACGCRHKPSSGNPSAACLTHTKCVEGLPAC